MSHDAVPPFTATRPLPNRRWLLALPVCALALLSACGGNHASPDPGPPAPTALRYDTEQALYVVGEPITPNNAHLTGGSLSTFSVTPALPGGLGLDSGTGLISGTPSALRRQATYTVNAGNGGGSTQAQVRITVTGRGAWSAVPTIPVARHYSTLSPLQDGRLLCAGGATPGGPIDSAHLYDPSMGNWIAAASMLQTRADPLAVTLLDGRVLVFGGSETGSGDALATAEIYDPVANTWTATGSLAESRIRATATLLNDGRVLVTGGFTSTPSLTFRNTVELYDPATGSWTLLPTPLSTRRAQHAAALLPDGNTLLLAGGVNSVGFVITAERYAVDGSATTVIPYGVGGNLHQAVPLDDGSVLITSDGSNASRRFDPGTSTWTTSTMSGARGLSTMTVLADGRVLLAGGSNLNTAEIYNPDVNLWTAATPMVSARHAAVAALLGDGSVLMVSGNTIAGQVNATERYVP